MTGHPRPDRSRDMPGPPGLDGRQPAVGDAAPGGHTAVEHAREELGAAATHGHRGGELPAATPRPA